MEITWEKVDWIIKYYTLPETNIVTEIWWLKHCAAFGKA